ncbi:hypothetical protein CDQ92_10650 [Sphingopyxis bauzanensis]|uniref:Rad50/SbcC-type AAA domain-containing protein n=1 Tax=Sphingopyxis bauzanensis TaxID=651663 RepID=A0A246JWK8_9SPHN|nr:AAA family ATPase [Sphingopyxis bauzanensis]OWQ97467.1 hypothetical protein CDQ92_10650 [Sphingopyxis bauzanensis]GGJ36232.1 GTP-binding protein [Sphingopyxis bauzanensis]
MILKSLEVANFRKFRDQLRIDGFTPGLNIVVEPNETGKSTLLEALRAALFIRYSAKTELVRSYVPIGDDVAPRVNVEFEVQGQSWSLEKQFMKAPYVRLTGAGSRSESDAAEEALQELLGFERGNNRGSDAEARGPLGMLWVEQASALAVEGPNRIVRDTVRGVLEAEVGAVTGGRRFDAIRANIETAYSALRTSKTGQSRGELATAELRVGAATSALQQAEVTLRHYEQALTDLESAKSRLRIVERDLADPEVTEQRKQLEGDKKVAETITLRTTAAEAQYAQFEERAAAAGLRLKRLDDAEARDLDARSQLEANEATRNEAKQKSDAAADEEKSLRGALEAARAERERCEAILTTARERVGAFAKAAAGRRAIVALKALSDLEERERALLSDAGATIDAETLDHLGQLERAAITARARFEAGAVKVDFTLADGTALRIDGKSSDASSIDILAATRIEIGDIGSLVIRPPEGSGRSIEADRASAEDALAAALRALDISSYSAALSRNERAGAANRELMALRKQIAAACPGDPTVGLAAGSDALHAFVSTLDESVTESVAPTEDIDELERAAGQAKPHEAAALARHEVARQSLAKMEKTLATAAADLAAATKEASGAANDLEVVLADGDRPALESTRSEALRERAAKFEGLEAARESAKAFDIESIQRRIENLERATVRANEDRVDLTGKIATLEAMLASEGTSGPGGQVAEAQDEEQAAIAAGDRLRREADTLEMLRKALAEAASEASRTFLAPVTKRAARYVQRLLPGCELSFDEELGPSTVVRAGIDESCGDLSRGTQEQLAILTRLAFADLLLEDGAPISLILDDPLVYSDDARLETMTDILQDASQRMQVILLTCRSKAFRHVDANRILLP